MVAAITETGVMGIQEPLPCPDGDLVELALLLPQWQAIALETMAAHRGGTPGQMVRDILEDFFGRFASARSARS
jgi:hypothetical protein